MKPTNVLSEAAIQRWAVRQLADYDACQPGTQFADGHVLGVTDAYKVQSEVVRLRRQRGEITIGYKVGCTSPKIRRQLGIDHCISGRLFDVERHFSGAELCCRRFANLAIEGELANELSRPPTADDFSGKLMPDCVSRVFPVIELHNHVIRGDVASAGELIANNAIHAGFVAGDGVASADFPESPDESSLKILSDGQVVDACQGGPLIQTIHSSLMWLMDWLQTRDEKLTVGQIVLTGSIPSLIPIQSNCRVRVDAPPFGSVEATFVN